MYNYAIILTITVDTMYNRLKQLKASYYKQLINKIMRFRII